MIYDYRHVAKMIAKEGNKPRDAKQLRTLTEKQKKAYNSVMNGNYYTYFYDSVKECLNDGAFVCCSEDNFKAVYAELSAEMINSGNDELNKAYEMMVDVIIKKSNRVLLDKQISIMRTEADHKRRMEAQKDKWLRKGFTTSEMRAIKLHFLELGILGVA